MKRVVIDLIMMTPIMLCRILFIPLDKGLPRVIAHGILSGFVIGVLFGFATGCVRNPLAFEEKPVFSESGEYVGMHTTVKAKPQAALGGKLQEGSGTLVYEGVDDTGANFTLTFGSSTKGMDSGDLASVLAGKATELTTQWLGMKQADPANVPPLRDFLTDGLTAFLSAGSGGGGMLSAARAFLGGG